MPRQGPPPCSRRLDEEPSPLAGVWPWSRSSRSSFCGRPTTIAGIGVLLTAGFAWAIYTVALPRTQLDLISLVLVVCTPSALAAVILGAGKVLPSRLLAGDVPISHIALFAALQGVGNGILSTLTYAYAVRALGSSIPAVTGAASPVLTTLLAVPFFGESITLGTAVALALIVGGVIAFNRQPALR